MRKLKKYAEKYDISLDPKNEADAFVLLAVEFGYIGCEKGWNLERTIQEFKDTLKGGDV